MPSNAANPVNFNRCFMISPPISAVRFKLKLILTTTVAASEPAVHVGPQLQQACKPRANCLKLKEI